MTINMISLNSHTASKNLYTHKSSFPVVPTLSESIPSPSPPFTHVYFSYSFTQFYNYKPLRPISRISLRNKNVVKTHYDAVLLFRFSHRHRHTHTCTHVRVSSLFLPDYFYLWDYQCVLNELTYIDFYIGD